MTQDLHTPATKVKDDSEGLNWARIAGITMAIAVHAGALFMMLAPMAAPPAEKAEQEVTMVNQIKPPPPPPPPPPEEPPKPIAPPKELSPPKQTTTLPPPPETPPIVFDDPSPVDLPPQPPRPPEPPRQTSTLGSVDPSSKAMNPPTYPPSAARAGIEGTVVLVISIDAQGNVLGVEVEKSSRNRDLDRAAIAAAKKWRFSPQVENGVAVASRVRVPVDFNLN